MEVRFITVTARDSGGDPIVIAADFIARVDRCDLKPRPYQADITLKNGHVVSVDEAVEQIKEMLAK